MSLDLNAQFVNNIDLKTSAFHQWSRSNRRECVSAHMTHNPIGSAGIHCAKHKVKCLKISQLAGLFGCLLIFVAKKMLKTERTLAAACVRASVMPWIVSSTD